MGSANSSAGKHDDDDYNIDAEVVGPDDAISVPNIPTPIDLKHSKMYIIYQRIDGISKTFVLTVKIIDDSVFVYVTDIYNEKTTLVHVAKISTKSESDNNHHLKYIQISRDFKIISLPENGYINVYNLTKLLNRNILEHIDRVGIVLKIDKKTGAIMSEIETSYDKQKNTDKIGNIAYEYVNESNLQPYKCVLCKDLFIVVCVEFNRYKKVIAIDYTKKIIHTTKNLDLDVNRSALKFSTNGRFFVIYDSPKKSVMMCDMLDADPVLKTIKLNVENETVLETLCISEDGRIIFYVDNDVDFHMRFCIYDVSLNKIHIQDPKIKVDREHINNIKFHLMDYSSFNDIDLKSETDCNKLYVLVGWDKTMTSAYYWMIRCFDQNYNMYDASFVNMKVNGKIEYIYNNGYMFIYKTQNGITAYDLNKVIPIRFASMLAAGSKFDLNTLYKQYYSERAYKYYENVVLVGADDSKVVYAVSEYMRFLLSLVKPEKSGVDTNVFQLRVNSNINIYGDVKSFMIFQDLLTGKSNQIEVISNIFTVKGQTGRHNMMRDLMNHMYEYTRVVALKETSENDIERSGFSNMKAIYIGYVLLVLIIKYYSVLVKTLNNEKSSSKKVLDKTKNVSVETTLIEKNTKRRIKNVDLDIINIFNENFPAFKSFTDRSLNLMLGERLD
jgi:hypothetical protein